VGQPSGRVKTFFYRWRFIDGLLPDKASGGGHCIREKDLFAGSSAIWRGQWQRRDSTISETGQYLLDGISKIAIIAERVIGLLSVVPNLAEGS
jgi:hypothetical protein